MIIKNKLISTLICWIIWVPLTMAANHLEMEFNLLSNRDGLSNGQVNTILQDKQGYVWFGTQSGLDRYDGFRFKNFFYNNLDVSSLANNSVDEIQQDVLGNLWIHTAVGYCIYQYSNEKFDRNPEKWLKKIGIEGYPQKVFIEANKNMWFVMYGKGVFFLDTKTMKHKFFSFAQLGVKDQKEVSCVTEQQGTAVFSFRNGTLCRVDGLKGKVLWVNRHLTQTCHIKDETVYTFIDCHNNYWVLSNDFVYVYSSLRKKWYDGMGTFIKSLGISMPTDNKILIRDIAYDRKNRLWIATDHDGLFVLDLEGRKCKQYVKREGMTGSIPDNSLQKVIIDRNDAVWIGTNKNGVAYYSQSSTKFSTIYLGDVCTITQDKLGNYWCGTNDAGIICYNPNTGERIHYGKAQTGLKSDVVVSSVTMSDGSMYFGTFNGGMTCYRNGQWKAYQMSKNGLAQQSVWALAEDKHHRLMIGTLGGGLQIMDTQKETFKTFNIDNSKIPSNYINSLAPMLNGDVLIGHSQNVTVLNTDTYKMTNYLTAKGGRSFPSPGINHAICDSRGLFWMATPAGVTMYDPKTGQMEILNDQNGTQGAVGCAVVEDKAHTIWLVSEFIVSHVKLSKDNRGKWEVNMTSYNYMDGLQNGHFNYRAAFLTQEGKLIVGGQDGINIIDTQMERKPQKHVKALFSGLVLFDHPLAAGEEYEGRVVFDKALDECRKLNLSYKENAFTIQLASTDVTVPSRNRFMYRMKGVTDKWMMTPLGRPEVTFTNLSPDTYTLQVKVVNGDGTVGDDVSEMIIDVNPPFYLSIWAYLLYVCLAFLLFYFYRKRTIEKQKIIFEKEKMEENIRKDRELNELKLNFFTNVSHELRTPLTLIISPLLNMIKKEEDEVKRHKLEMIHRNADRLLQLVNQILDFRKIEQSEGKLTLTLVEVVSYVENICRSFQLLANNKIRLNFTSSVSQLLMEFDVDKLGKIVNNLLSNAYKFTPDHGSVTVSLSVVKELVINGSAKDVLQIQVADTGKGISDEDKRHIFDRFYQVNGTEMQPYGGSGIGLNLVKAFADLHGGNVTVADNPGGGTVFTVNIPLRQDSSIGKSQDGQVNPVVAASSALVASATSATLGSSSESSVASSAESSIQTNGTTTVPSDGSSSVASGGSSPVASVGSSSVASVGSSNVPLDSSSKVPSEETVVSLKPKVLLVDDSDDFREFMSEVLSENYVVEEAVNGKEAWEKLQTQPLPDIILSDVMMPEMDGNELCKLAKGNELTADIPFVVLTARLASEHKKEGLENGADEYITKPFDIDLLNLRIRNLMKWAKRKNANFSNAQPLSATSATGHDALSSGSSDEGTFHGHGMSMGTFASDGSLSAVDSMNSDIYQPGNQQGNGTPTAQAEEGAPVVQEYVMTEGGKKFLRNVDIYIRDNMGDPDTGVESMSSHLCISRVQLYKRMVSLTGTTPSEYLRAKRIHWAEELLRTGDYTVSEIAYKVGFNNPRYFSKYFQDEYGMTPSQYKKKIFG